MVVWEDRPRIGRLIAEDVIPAAGSDITLAPKKLIRTRRASEGSASEPSLARRVRARKSISVTNEVRVQLYHQAQYNQCVTIIDLRALSMCKDAKLSCRGNNSRGACQGEPNGPGD